MTMTISFPGGVRVDATFKGHTVHTDQPLRSGGEDSALSPFDLFLASIATCMGFYALRFCQERGLDTGGLGLTLDPVRDQEKKRLTVIRIDLRLPEAFPEKYREPIKRAVEHCAVKQAVLDPPGFELTVI